MAITININGFELYPEQLDPGDREELMVDLNPDQIIMVLTADEFTLLQDVLAGEESAEYYRDELDTIIQEAIS